MVNIRQMYIIPIDSQHFTCKNYENSVKSSFLGLKAHLYRSLLF